MNLALRFVIYLIGFSVLIGLLYGGAVLVLENNAYALYTLKYVYPFCVVVAFGLAILHSRSLD